MMILVYASEHEVKYITAPLCRVCIGVGASEINRLDKIVNPNRIILFGSCGDLGHHRTDVFYTRTDNMLTLPNPLHDKFQRIYFSECGYETVDMETEIVQDYCRERHIELMVYRYIIDRVDRKVMPVGINHFWRIWQHFQMQRKFDKMLLDGSEYV